MLYSCMLKFSLEDECDPDMPRDDFHFHLLAQLFDFFDYVPAYCLVYHLAAVLRGKCDTVPNHTRLYKYRHGKMLMR